MKTNIPAVQIIIIVMIGMILGFHVVHFSGEVKIIPKQNLSFSDTFVNAADLVDEYNACKVFQREECVSVYLVRKLGEKGIIHRSGAGLALFPKKPGFTSAGLKLLVFSWAGVLLLNVFCVWRMIKVYREEKRVLE